MTHCSSSEAQRRRAPGLELRAFGRLGAALLLLRAVRLLPSCGLWLSRFCCSYGGGSVSCGDMMRVGSGRITGTARTASTWDVRADRQVGETIAAEPAEAHIRERYLYLLDRVQVHLAYKNSTTNEKMNTVDEEKSLDQFILHPHPYGRGRALHFSPVARARILMTMENSKPNWFWFCDGRGRSMNWP